MISGVMARRNDRRSKNTSAATKTKDRMAIA